ncbi:MAG: GNAT family N-acetyltransferase [Oceanidesulfovibrio sp.]
MHIRSETASDHDAIRTIHIAAFADHPFSRHTEHLIVDALREAGALAISLVADVDGDVIGHIAFSPVLLNGAVCGMQALGPVGVLPRLQRRGVGSGLVAAGLTALRENGASACVLVGDPAFYGRFGFTSSHALTMEGVPPDVFLSLRLSGEVARGVVTHHEAFSVGAH